MDVMIGELETRVQAIEPQSLPRPEQYAAIADAIAPLVAERQSSDRRALQDTSMWTSVRAGTGR
ncbi:hypothetical protein [Solirubrobacter soli]|uniref:hypothetical protein n=1 Tax=Solirubrobacter soli TaxID=363832 RepID=UPI0003F75D0F|nr:hypothetical protein [Solirubrobacter soli]